MKITTPEDYARWHKDLDASCSAVWAQAKAENWSDERIIDGLARAKLPFARAITDPSNPDATALQRVEMLRDEGLPNRIPGPNEFTDIRALIAHHTTELNRLHHTNYPPPTIVVVDGFAQKHGESPAEFSASGDMMILDSAGVESLRNDPQAMSALIGHELGHRYQRGDDQLLARLKASTAAQYNVRADAQTINQERVLEADADFQAAQVASPKAVTHMLATFMGDARLTWDHFRAERLGLGENDHLAPAWNKLSMDQRRALLTEYQSLDGKAMEGLTARTLLDDEKRSVNIDHPSFLARDELQAALTAHPELLKRNLRFDRDANIIGVEDKGPAYTPNQLTAINQQADRDVGVRGGR